MVRQFQPLTRHCRSLNSFQSKTFQVRYNMTQNMQLSSDPVEKWLVVGDGDFSYSASIAAPLADKNIQLYATVLEDELKHRSVYERSQSNTEMISMPHHPHQICFGIDGTALESHFSTTRFDRIQFNFPHWKGKTNAKHNRLLLDGFLTSAAGVLKPTGSIHIALCERQGGMPCNSLEEWRQSWMVAMYAANHGLLLHNLVPFDPDYGLRSHRGMDRPFWIGDAQMYSFRFPSTEPIPKEYQISCRHELRVMLHADKMQESPMSWEEIVEGDAVWNECQRHVPDGIRAEIAARHLFTPQKDVHVPLAVFLMTYSGETKPLTRMEADGIRHALETNIAEK
eukprot:Nitzschia sp. Nitz4//scaffold350_size17454//3851//4864//NITZ4_008817-RA/size17454-exonerate_est2genome-gene-0.21-mRNA-1//-1//CDS//3329548865//3337//frame0